MGTVCGNPANLESLNTLTKVPLYTPKERADIPVYPYTDDEFVLYQCIGTGAFGRVVLVKWTRDNNFYALKILDREMITSDFTDEFVKRIDLELFFLKNINHPFFAPIIARFEDPDKNLDMYLLELCIGGHLADVVKETPLKEEEVKLYAAQALLLISHCHRHRIVHRDLRPHNILLHADGYVRVIDVGISAQLRTNESETLPKTNEFPELTIKSPSFSVRKRGSTGEDLLGLKIGAMGWKAPEMIRNKGYSYGVDFWNLGLTIYTLLVGRDPFGITRNPLGFLDKYPDWKARHKKVTVPSWLSKEATDIIRRLLTAKVKDRLGCGDFTPGEGRFKGDGLEIMNHPFFKGVDWDAMLKKECKNLPPVKVAINTDEVGETGVYKSVREAMDIIDNTKEKKQVKSALGKLGM